MRICQVGFSHYPEFATLYEYTQKLACLDHDVAAIAIKRNQADPNAETVNGVSVRRLDIPDVVRSRIRGQLAFLRHVARQIKPGDFDIVHIHAFRGAGLLPLYFHRGSAKWVLDIRTVSLAGGARSKLSHTITRLESNTFDGILAIDDQVGQQVLGSGTRWRMIPIGVDTQKFSPGLNEELRRHLGYHDDHVIAVYCGTLRPQRQLCRLVEAFCQAARQNLNLHLLFLGDGPELPRLKQLATTSGMLDRIAFTGYVHYDQVPAYLRASDFALSFVPATPEFDIQPPTKTLEYMACGVPTLATDTQGNRRYIQDGYNGVLVRDEIEAWRQALQSLLSRDYYDALSQRAVESVRPYDWRAIVESHLIPSYEELLTG